MDEIFGWDTLRYRRELEVYRSEDIEVPENLTILHGLPEEVNVVTHKIGRGVYVNRINCSTLPSFDCDIFKGLPSRNSGDTNLWHTAKKSAKEEALRLEKQVVRLFEESSNKTYGISAIEAGVPMYYVFEAQNGNYFTLVAGKIAPSGEL